MKKIISLLLAMLMLLTTLLLTSCNEEKPFIATDISSGASQGLEYIKYSYNGMTGYAVSSMGKCDDVVVTIPEKVNGDPVICIKSHAISGMQVKLIYVPDSVLIIEDKAFDKCTQLEKVVIGKEASKLSWMGYMLFSSSAPITTVEYAGNISQWQKIEKNSDGQITWNYQGGTASITVFCDDGTLFYHSNDKKDPPEIEYYPPENPNNPDTPDNPDDPANPDNPNTPDNPDNPTQPQGHVCVESGWIMDKEATDTTVGFRHTECTTCGKIVSKEVLYDFVTGGFEEEIEYYDEWQGNELVAIEYYNIIGIGSVTGPDIVIPNYYSSICYGAFEGDGAKTLVILNPYLLIADGAFIGYWSSSNYPIYTIVSPILSSAFIDTYCSEFFYTKSLEDYCKEYNCSAIFHSTDLYIENKIVRHLVIPESIENLSNNAFAGVASLESVTIHKNFNGDLEKIFVNCSNLTQVFIDENNPNYKVVDNVVYSKDGKTLIWCPAGRSGKFTVPDGVTTIGAYAFNGCSKLEKITLSESVKYIGENAFYGCSDGIFDIYLDCKYLPSANNEHYALIESLTDYETDCHSDTVIIADCAFYGKSMSYVCIPDKVTHIGNEAFAWCDYLEEIDISSSVEYIGNLAFYSCDCLKNIVVDANNNSFKSIDGNLYSKDGKIFIQYAIGKESNYFELPDGVITIGKSAFEGSNYLYGLTIPKSVKYIGSGAFAYVYSVYGDYGTLDIEYEGTKREFSAIYKEDYWNECTATCIICEDGELFY